MTTRLETLWAERDALEQAGEWDHAAYDWLCEQVEALEREEAARPSAPAPTAASSPAGAVGGALQRDDGGARQPRALHRCAA
jgi:hypothetical protein